MKLNILAIVLMIFFLPQSDHYQLYVTVSGLKPLKGDLYISLHNRPEYFQEPDSAFMKLKVAVNKETQTVVFKDVPAGKYAIALYHDENQDGVMAKNDKGIPKEGYGFSTKSKFLGRPKFEQAAFMVNGNDTLEVKMLYPPLNNDKNN